TPTGGRLPVSRIALRLPDSVPSSDISASSFLSAARSGPPLIWKARAISFLPTFVGEERTNSRICSFVGRPGFLLPPACILATSEAPQFGAQGERGLLGGLVDHGFPAFRLFLDAYAFHRSLLACGLAPRRLLAALGYALAEQLHGLLDRKCGRVLALRDCGVHLVVADIGSVLAVQHLD